MVDWNIGHWQPEKPQPEVQQFDSCSLVPALHHLFTGRQALFRAVALTVRKISLIPLGISKLLILTKSNGA
jgi:hypothetical protein